MKLSSLILASALMITGSMQAMNVIETQSKQASHDRTACCLTGLAAFCCCPCLVLKCIRDSICPTVVIVNQVAPTPPNNNK